MGSLVLNLRSIAPQLSDEQFYAFCMANQDLRFELSSQGELIIMPPVGGETGEQEAELIIDVGNWNRQAGLGKVFSSSTMFKLPNGAARSPDVAWVELSRWEALSPTERSKFPPITPDFVIELRSPSDSLKEVQQKMQEYLDNGLRLGWLIDPQNRQVEIYRPQRWSPTDRRSSVETLSLPATLSGERVLPGFTLRLS